VQSDEHLLSVARYVEQNALSAGLVERAEQWPYGSPCARSQTADPTREFLADWTTGRPADWVERVNTPLSAREMKRFHFSVTRGRTFGDDRWTDGTARRMGPEDKLRPEDRPPKTKSN
jgi:putative transposase